MTILFSVESRAEKRIGIFTFTEETRYSDNQKGIIDQLKKDGFEAPAVKFTIENAKGSKARAAEIAQAFASSKMDLIFTIGTSATIPIAMKIKDKPVVFSAVYDPVESGIAADWKSSGNNTTGTSTRIPMSDIMRVTKQFLPVKRLAVIYTPGEKNSEAQLKEIQGLQANSQIRVIPIILTNKEEAVQILSEVVNNIEAIYLTGSSVVGGLAPTVINMANKAQVVTITHLDDIVDKGALLGMCINSYHAGSLSGKLAVKILKGAKPSNIPIEPAKNFDIILNMKTARAGKFQIPPKFLKTVTRTIE
jgi:putative ABC transport system substrate-binding protein